MYECVFVCGYVPVTILTFGDLRFAALVSPKAARSSPSSAPLTVWGAALPR